jgi:hypothetical protein
VRRSYTLSLPPRLHSRDHTIANTGHVCRYCPSPPIIYPSRVTKRFIHVPMTHSLSTLYTALMTENVRSWTVATSASRVVRIRCASCVPVINTHRATFCRSVDLTGFSKSVEAQENWSPRRLLADSRLVMLTRGTDHVRSSKDQARAFRIIAWP